MEREKEERKKGDRLLKITMIFKDLMKGKISVLKIFSILMT